MSPCVTTTNAVPHVGIRMAVVVWVQFVMMGLQGWTTQSVAMWFELANHRLEKVYHYKSTTRNDHEFIIYEFTNEHTGKDRLELRSDRSIVERKDGSSSLSGICVENERNSDNSIFDINSNRHLVADTVVRIKGYPARSRVLRTITFNGDHSLRPSLWDVMILVLVVHNDGALDALTRQCYWFADTIFGSLEKWVANHNNGTVIIGEKGRAKWKIRRASTGSHGIATVHRPNAAHIDNIWANFEKERQAMTQQKEEYERARTEETEKMRRLADEVRELRYQLELKSKVREYQSMPHLQQNDSEHITYDEDIDRHSSRRISFLSRIRQIWCWSSQSFDVVN